MSENPIYSHVKEVYAVLVLVMVALFTKEDISLSLTARVRYTIIVLISFFNYMN